MVKKILTVFLIISLAFTVVSCDKEKVFGHAELTIALTDDFSEIEAESFDAAYSNGESVVGIYRISFAAGFNQGIPDFLTAREFASFYMKASGRNVEIKEAHNVPYYEYTEEQEGLMNSYLASFFRSKYAYFVILFATSEALYRDLAAEFLDFADTVIFTK